MKKLVYVLPLALLLSCAGLFGVVAERGMTEEQFKRRNLNYVLVEMFDNITVYRAPDGNDTPKYLYFENGILIRLDEGQMMMSRWNPFMLPPEGF